MQRYTTPRDYDYDENQRIHSSSATKQPKNRNNEGQDKVAIDTDHMKKYHELLRQAEREQDPIEKVSLEQRAEYFRKLAEQPENETS